MWRACVALILAVSPVLADAPLTSIRPEPRPDVAVPATQLLPAAATIKAADVPVVSVRPRARPLGIAAVAPVQTQISASGTVQPERRGLLAALFGTRPRTRPGTAAEDKSAAAPTGNFVCGDPALTGQALAPIRSRTRGCGVDEPVSITAIDGIALSEAATLDCPTALALREWVDQGLRPAFPNKRIATLQVAGHYICRARNNVRGARISEHGRGKAIDISDGTILTVAGNWNRSMRNAYKAACGIFGTTLGPGSDGYHEDHMHFDTASHRNGSYCR
jgi:hypothetical protein